MYLNYCLQVSIFLKNAFKIIKEILYFGLDSNELRRKLARGEEEQADKIREFNEEVQL